MKNRNYVLLLASISILAMLAAIVFAENNVPLGAENVTVIQTETANLSLYNASSVNAEAGNVTELLITGVSQTKRWQGYYGNVSGTIILEDAQGNRFYDWSAAEPQGEVYASVNQTITWTTVECAPTDNATYLAEWNAFYNITPEDDDAINLTYNYTDHNTFYTGTTTLTGCPTTYTFVNNVGQHGDFPAVLLTSDTNGTMIFTSILEDDTDGIRASLVGFDSAEHDFQLLVAEDGSAGNDAVTEYFFWIEIE